MPGYLGFDLYDHRDRCFKEPGRAPQSCQSLAGGRAGCVSTAEASSWAGAGKENWATDGGFSQQGLASDRPSLRPPGQGNPCVLGEAPDGAVQAAAGTKGAQLFSSLAQGHIPSHSRETRD